MLSGSAIVGRHEPPSCLGVHGTENTQHPLRSPDADLWCMVRILYWISAAVKDGAAFRSPEQLAVTQHA